MDMILKFTREQGVQHEKFSATIECTEDAEFYGESIGLIQNLFQTVCKKVNESEDYDALNEFLQAMNKLADIHKAGMSCEYR